MLIDPNMNVQYQTSTNQAMMHDFVHVVPNPVNSNPRLKVNLHVHVFSQRRARTHYNYNDDEFYMYMMILGLLQRG